MVMLVYQRVRSHPSVPTAGSTAGATGRLASQRAPRHGQLDLWPGLERAADTASRPQGRVGSARDAWHWGIWLGYGWDMVGIWLGYGWDMVGIWLGYGWDMVGIWLGYGWDMVGIWLGDGWGMVGGWLGWLVGMIGWDDWLMDGRLMGACSWNRGVTVKLKARTWNSGPTNTYKYPLVN